MITTTTYGNFVIYEKPTKTHKNCYLSIDYFKPFKFVLKNILLCTLNLVW